uniref:Uncharacterized protein n=1 Tax=Anguilla anguilla TaxID=7936 RepID=A0A0E9UNH2_ANGAN
MHQGIHFILRRCECGCTAHRVLHLRRLNVQRLKLPLKLIH